ncbi:putative methyltransferase [Nymphaea thermarum]|nr:putative methyltransferase [Nymphaea thermarum]
MAKMKVEIDDGHHQEEEGEHKRRKKAKKMKKERTAPEEGTSFHLPTVSIAVCGSIIDNAQSLELATRVCMHSTALRFLLFAPKIREREAIFLLFLPRFLLHVICPESAVCLPQLAGQIARAATIFRIDEVVVFDDKASSSDESCVKTVLDGSTDYEGGAPFLVRILQYLETPQYLRRSLFPKHNSLRFVGLLPPLDAPHHVRKHEWLPYRVTLTGKPSGSPGTLVDVGLNKEVVVEQTLEPGRRVTVAMGSNRQLESIIREVTSPSKPREELGLYWGYKVRYASNISCVFTECPFKDGYDYKIGTSEHGDVLSSSEVCFPNFRHLLIAFGGLGGLEENIEEDTSLKGKNVRKVFNSYLNTCPGQGSRTIRTEYFQEPIKRAVTSVAD